MAGPQRSDTFDSTAAEALPDPARAVLPAFDLDIAPLRPVMSSAPHSAPSFGPLRRGRDTPVDRAAPAPDTSPAGRALDALAALLATPLGTPLSELPPVPTPVAAPASPAPVAKTVAPQVLALLDEQAGEPEVGFATTTIAYAAPAVQSAPVANLAAPAGSAEHIIRSTRAVQRAAFEISSQLTDHLPQLQPAPQVAPGAAPTATHQAGVTPPLPDDLPFGSVSYRLFVI